MQSLVSAGFWITPKTDIWSQWCVGVWHRQLESAVVTKNKQKVYQSRVRKFFLCTFPITGSWDENMQRSNTHCSRGSSLGCAERKIYMGGNGQEVVFVCQLREAMWSKGWRGWIHCLNSWFPCLGFSRQLVTTAGDSLGTNENRQRTASHYRYGYDNR